MYVIACCILYCVHVCIMCTHWQYQVQDRMLSQMMKQLLLLLLFLVIQLTVGEETISCPNTSATGATKPLYLLTLIIGGDDELSVLSGARIV